MNKRRLSFKWFGSLTNLSFRRTSSDKLTKGAAAGGAAGSEGAGLAEGVGVAEGVANTNRAASTVDDMGVRARLPSYVRSSDMYSHTGTMPRELSRKKAKERERGGKASRKGRAEAGPGPELSRSQSVRPADHVCDSPLLSALSSQGRPPTLPQGAAKPPATRGSPVKIEEAEGDRGIASPNTHPDPDPDPDPNPNPDPDPNPDPNPDPDPNSEAKCAPAEQLKVRPCTAMTESPVAGETVPPGGNAAQMQQSDAALSKGPQAPASETKQPPCQAVLPMKRRRGAAERREGERKEEETPTERRCGPEEQSTPGKEVQPAPPHTHQQRETDYSQMEPSGHQEEYVQFSKEKYLLESPPEKLRKELEEELKLSSSDMRSYAWYHGHTPREVSESLVLRNGDFLVRESLTQAGEYVVTSRWKQEACHARVSKVLVKGGESQVRYVLEGLEGEAFDSLPALVCAHVATRRPVCPRSGAQICCPINRTLPLRYLEATFALANGRPGSAHSPASPRGAYIKRRSVTMTDGLTTEKAIPHSPSTIHHHKESMRSCALSMDQIQEFRCPLSPVGETPLSPAYSAVSRHRHGSGGRVLAVIPPSPAVPRRSSDPQLSPSPSSSGPPLCSSSGGAQAPHPPPCGPPGPCGPPSQSYVERLRVEDGRGGVGGPGGGEREQGGFTLPLVESSSSLHPAQYRSTLLPPDNKPLEMAVLKRVKELMADTDARTVAMHITKADCTVARILGVTKETQRMMGVSSGLELLTLPHGHQLRLDLLERFYTMSILVAVDVLGCTGSTEERASLLHKTIQLAAELKSLGNMYGFAAVMRALELPQISRLEQTWMALRQRHTEGAILYEKKLKPFLKAVNDGKESCVLSNTCFPPVVPLLSLLERGVAVGVSVGVVVGVGEGLEPWESVEAGVDVVMSHLETGRTIAHHGTIYRSNAEAKLKELQESVELAEIVCTEFQMRLLWGCRGSEGPQAERYHKFDKVLSALSHKLEPPVRHSEL